jgi:hypothetical protein
MIGEDHEDDSQGCTGLDSRIFSLAFVTTADSPAQAGPIVPQGITACPMMKAAPTAVLRATRNAWQRHLASTPSAMVKPFVTMRMIELRATVASHSEAMTIIDSGAQPATAPVS